MGQDQAGRPADLTAWTIKGVPRELRNKVELYKTIYNQEHPGAEIAYSDIVVPLVKKFLQERGYPLDECQAKTIPPTSGN